MSIVHLSVKLFEAIAKTSYSQVLQNEIINVIYDLFNTKVSNSFLITRQYSNHEETIFVIQHYLPVIYESKQESFVPLLIYLPSKFPLVGPEIYLQKNNINLLLKTDSDLINNSTLKINYELIEKWDSKTKNMGRILQIIKKELDKNFPWKKVAYPVLCYTGACILHIEHIIPIILYEDKEVMMHLKENPKLKQQDNYKCDKTSIEVKTKNNHCITPVLKGQTKTNNAKALTEYNDKTLINELASIRFISDKEEQEEIKRILCKEILNKLPTIIILQKRLLSEDKYKLMAILQKLKDKQKNCAISLNLTTSFDILNKQLNHIQSNYINEINEKETIPPKPLLYKNLTNLITINLHNHQILHYICMEKTIEEFLFSLRKSIEKGLLPIDEIIKHHLISTRQIFYIHHLKQKAL